MAQNAWIPTKGDIILTRNVGGREGNTSPGFWNHTAVCIDGKSLVHALATTNDVTMEPIAQLLAEVEFAIVLRLKNTRNRNMFVRKVYGLIGAPYKAIASMFYHLRKTSHGENCVSVARKAFRDSHGYDPGWQKPDDIFHDNKRLTMVGKKNVRVFRKDGKRHAVEPGGHDNDRDAISRRKRRMILRKYG